MNFIEVHVKSQQIINMLEEDAAGANKKTKFCKDSFFKAKGGLSSKQSFQQISRFLK